MKKIITLSGDIGGGKSAVSKYLENILGYKIIGTGAIQREIAQKRGLTTLELNQLSITDSSVDEEIDGFVINLGKTAEDIIIDSRLAWHFIPEAFKTFLTVDARVGAERVFSDSRAQESNPTLEKTLENNLKRQGLEKARFKQLYNVDLRNFNNYDVVVDTSYTSPEVIAVQLNKLFQLALSGQLYPKLWLNPKRLTATKAQADISAGNFKVVAESLQSQGFDFNTPIQVSFNNDQYLIVDGHQRALAAYQLGIGLIPCVLVNTDETASLIAQVGFSWG